MTAHVKIRAGQVIMLVTALLVEKCEKIFKFK